MTSRRVRDAWDVLYAALPEGWVLQRPRYRPTEGTWAGSAGDARPAASDQRQWIEAYGADEATCLLALAQQLRLRSAELEGAEPDKEAT